MSFLRANWDIDNASGHCRHTSGADAYFDPNHRHGLELPLIGPFSKNRLEQSSLVSLITELERSHPARFVVWGAESTRASREVTFMGVDTLWQPDYSMRTLLLTATGQLDQLSREWNISGDRVTAHKTGPSFSFEGGCIVLVDNEYDGCVDTFMAAVSLATNYLTVPAAS